MKAAHKLEQTKNYALFEHNTEQRSVKEKHVAGLVESMSIFGFLPSKPVQCYRSNGKLIVIDGHHRLAAAMALGIPVIYVEEPKENQAAMSSVNSKVLKWKFEDYIRQYAMRGDSEYLILEEYIKRGLPVQAAVSLLSGETPGSFNKAHLIPDGKFTVMTITKADQIVSLIEADPSNTVFRHSNFVRALGMCLWVKEFDFETFKQRALRNGHMIPRCSNVDDFLRSIEEVYNFRSRNIVPVAVLAKQAAKERNPTFKKISK